MTPEQQREAARQFANKWSKGGDEKSQCHLFWIDLLQKVLGVENATEYISFEMKVKVPEGDGKVHTRFIDGYIPAVKALIEQKGYTHPLDVKEPQSGGEMLTPYEQAKRYNDNLPYGEKARWIITCNFTDLWIYDMDTTVPAPQKIRVVDLQDKYALLSFLVKQTVKKIPPEIEISVRAGDIVGKIYDALLKQYGVPESSPKGETEQQRKKREHKLRSLNALCVRLVFCLYAEDAPGLFQHYQFHDYLAQYPAKDIREALKRLFNTLDTRIEERDEYLDDDLKAFPYVNGGLFSDQTIEIPQFTEEIKHLLIVDASEEFDWKHISPTIFGAVLESTHNPETRRAGGMRYTSIKNIHKVIDPLFLDDLETEFKQICDTSVGKVRNRKLDAFQKKLGTLVFLENKTQNWIQGVAA